jgi:hypothetical protein
LPIGSGEWWLQKAPMVFVAALLLISIVALSPKVEQRVLLDPVTPWTGLVTLLRRSA